MDEVIPGIFIGDFQSTNDLINLEKNNIKSIISAMRQNYTPPLSITLLQISIDDDEKTNIISHFTTTNNFIKEALLKKESILIHCQAGISRSSTLIAAYLMKELNLTTEEAIGLIKLKRNQIEPSLNFVNQLEIWERCEYTWDPVKWVEQRRFLMQFAQASIMDGASPALVLAYYPSPNPSPGSTISTDPFKMTPSTTEIESILSESSSAIETMNSKNESIQPPTHKRLTPKSKAKELEPESSLSNGNVAVASSSKVNNTTVEKIGIKGEVIVSGKRIRCRMCRRELASRPNIIVHEPGIGQQAFAPRRRDMGAYRHELERRRLDEIDKEIARDSNAADNAEASPAGGEIEIPVVDQLSIIQKEKSIPSNPTVSTISTPAVTIPGLRIAKPFGLIPGLRVAVPRPKPISSLPLPSSTTPPSSPPSIPTLPPPDLQIKSLEPPLLPSHLCSSYFLEPLSWMSSALESGELSGKLFCPGLGGSNKCGAKLGSWDWAGEQCSCGSWVVPAFSVGVSRVDEVGGN